MLLVKRRLGEEHRLDVAPTIGNFRLAKSKIFFEAGLEVHVDVDPGRGLEATVYDAWWDRNLGSLLMSSTAIAEKIVQVIRDADDTRAMVAEVNTAARREITKAKRRGLPYELTAVTLTPVQAGSHDQVVTRVEHLGLGRSNQCEPFAFQATRAEDVRRAFEGIEEQQERRKELAESSIT